MFQELGEEMQLWYNPDKKGGKTIQNTKGNSDGFKMIEETMIQKEKQV